MRIDFTRPLPLQGIVLVWRCFIIDVWVVKRWKLWWELRVCERHTLHYSLLDIVNHRLCFTSESIKRISGVLSYSYHVRLRVPGIAYKKIGWSTCRLLWRLRNILMLRCWLRESRLVLHLRLRHELLILRRHLLLLNRRHQSHGLA